MRNKKNSGPMKLLCFILCFTFMFVAASNMVFAKGNEKNDKAHKETHEKGNEKNDKAHKEPHDKGDAYKRKVDTIQTFVLDSMESKKNKEIANKLSGCTNNNISATAKSIGDLLKGKWDSKKGMSDIKDVLDEYLGFTQKAKLAITMIIREGFKGVVIPEILSGSIKAKINADITGNSGDNRGIKFMVKAIQILQRVASLSDQTFVTISFNNGMKPCVEFNRMEGYSYVTSSISDVLSVMHYLPFEKDFESFVTYYENYLESCKTFEIVSFVYLLRDNNIPYKVVVN